MEASETRKPEGLGTTRLNTLWRVVLVFVACYSAALVGGLSMVKDVDTVWPMWPGCAVLTAILLVSPRKTWPWLIPAGLAGFLLYDIPAGIPVSSVILLNLADVVEVLVAAYGVQYLSHGVSPLSSLRAFWKYIVVATILGPLLGTIIGMQSTSAHWMNMHMYMLSDGLAFLTITPAILGWMEHLHRKQPVRRGYYLEAALVLAAVFVLCLGIFAERGMTRVSPALLYSLVPFLLWAAIRFGPAGAGTVACTVAVVSIWGAAHGRGPFTQGDPVNTVYSLQEFLLFAALPFMTLAVVVAEGKRQAVVLRESEQRFRLMADSAPTLIWMSGTDQLCTFFSRGWLEFTGRSMQEELGDGWAEGVHTEDLERCVTTYSAAFDARVKFEMEYRLRRHDGEYRWVVDYGTPRFDSDGVFCGYVGSCVDITERKLSEISLRDLTGRLLRAQEEERARIARELHDDISQRMAFLQIGLEQFEQSRVSLAPKERQELQNLSQVASEISSDLHSLSHKLHPARLDLQGLVAATGSLCRELAEQHDLQIRFTHHDVPTDMPMEVSLCLFRVVQEALRNVVKHGRTNEAEVELRGQAEGMELRISDFGAGFDTKAIPANGGLGLISMGERLRLIGGELMVVSRPTEGTQLRVRVPLAGERVRIVEARPVQA